MAIETARKMAMTMIKRMAMEMAIVVTILNKWNDIYHNNCKITQNTVTVPRGFIKF